MRYYKIYYNEENKILLQYHDSGWNHYYGRVFDEPVDVATIKSIFQDKSHVYQEEVEEMKILEEIVNRNFPGMFLPSEALIASLKTIPKIDVEKVMKN